MIIDPVHAAQATVTAPAADSVSRADFGALLEGGLGRVDKALTEADQMLKTYAAGGDVAVHDLVIAMEKARFSLQLAAEVRNRVVESYQEFMRMQV